MASATPLLRQTLHDWLRHRCMSKSAALAFYTLFSLAPILVLVIALAGTVFGAAAAGGEIVRQLKGLIGAQGAAAVEALIKGARDPATGLAASVAAGAMLLLGSTTAFAELKDSLDEIWSERPRPDSGILQVIRDRLLSFGLVLALGFLLLVSLTVNAVLAVVASYWSGWAGESTLMVAVSSFFTFLVITALFAVIYKLLPPVSLAWTDVGIGAGITAALFAVGKYAIGLYLGNATLTSSLGAVGSFGVLALWVYYSAQIFFLGAEFTRLYAQQHGSLRGRAESGVEPPDVAHRRPAREGSAGNATGPAHPS
jgi:membrane protein